MKNIDLFTQLIHSETEDEVLKILIKYNIWDNSSLWKPYGGIENNLSIISAQQKDPFAAFAEKVVNSIDAILLRECKRENISPESIQAPKTLQQAVKRYKNNILKDDIQIYATGNEKKSLNIVIMDYGEGQSPASFEKTLLSLNKSNKLRIPFVQGKFNMGSTGVLPFCGNHNFQLMLSKKDPSIAVEDNESNLWSFTITRKNSSDQDTKSSVIEYLVIDDKIPTLDKEILNILPDRAVAGATYTCPMQWGTYLKLYNYKTKHNSVLKGRFTWKLSNLLPGLPLNAFVSDRRDVFSTPSNQLTTTLKGNRERLLVEDRLVKGFPLNSKLVIHEQTIEVETFLLKSVSDANDSSAYKDKEGIAYIINGQVHGYTLHSIFNKRGIELNYIYKNLLVYVDITSIEKRYREELLMSNRESLRDSVFKQELEDLVVSEIKNTKQLYIENEKVRKDLLKDKVHNHTHILNSLKKVLKNNPTIASLFDVGIQIPDKNSIENGDKKRTPYIGNYEPTFFTISADYNLINPKEVPLNKMFRIKLNTDAKNDFFSREDDVGEFQLLSDKEFNFSHSVSLADGICSLSITLPDNINTGDMILFDFNINSSTQKFENSFVIRVTKPERKKTNQSTVKKKKDNTSLNLPNMAEIYKDEWDKYRFNKSSVLSVSNNDFYINMDNIYLTKNINANKDKKEQYQEEYKAIYMMYGLALQHKNNNIEDENEQIDIQQTTSALAPVIFETSMIIEDLRKG